MISFLQGKMKVRIVTEERITTPHDNSLLYAGVHMLNGFGDDKMDSFLDDHPMIVPLLEIDVLMAVEP